MNAVRTDWVPPLKPSDHTEQAPFPHRSKTNVDDLARAIVTEINFAKDSGGRLYAYRDGVYKSIGERLIRQRAKSLMGEWGLAEKWTTHLANEVCEYIRVDCPELWSDPPVDTINVLNGLLDVRTRTLRPHSPDFTPRFSCRFTLTPRRAARAGTASSRGLPGRFRGHCMGDGLVDDAREQHPEGGPVTWRGRQWKEHLLAGVRRLPGQNEHDGPQSSQIGAGQVCGSQAYGQLANIGPDLPTAHLSSTSMFKALTGGGVRSAEYKFRDSFEYVPFCKLVFSANKPPQSMPRTVSSDAGRSFLSSDALRRARPVQRAATN